MRYFLATAFLTLATLPARAGIDVIYGKDNRQEVYQTSNSLHKTLAKSTAGMISINMFSKAGTNLFDLLGTKPLGEAENLCSSEAFVREPLAAMCSGFLVGPDTLITAGHCYLSFASPEEVCKRFAWVFDFDMKSETSDPTKGIPLSNIYLCKKVIASDLSATADYSIIKLDRPVVGRAPLKFRTSGKISNSANLVVIGHPNGLPTKITDGGKINRNVEATRFSTNLDTFHGNSGSAVFDANTGVIEGILIQGKNDYTPSNPKDPEHSCKVMNKCDDNGNHCTAGDEIGPIQWGEVVLRITTISSKINSALSVK